MKFTMIVDLNERGSFRAHVEDENGNSIFPISNEDEEGNEGEVWLVVDGYMDHCRDTDGLLEYLVMQGFASVDDTMSLVK